MRRLFEEILGQPIGKEYDRDVFGNMFDNIKGVPDVYKMKTDIVEEEKVYCIYADLPGFAKEEIEIDVVDGVLTISARKVIEETEEKKYIKKERTETSMTRRFAFEGIMEENITAKMENGVLEVIVPKKPIEIVDTKKKINIE